MEFVCFVWISEQTANFALHSIKSVYCAVRTDSLYKTYVSSLKGIKTHIDFHLLTYLLHGAESLTS